MSLSSFTESQVRAWDFVRSAIDEGMANIAARDAYRANGGTIGNVAWSQLYNAYKEAGSVWDQVTRFRPNETIPENMWLQAPRDFNNTYVVEVHAQVRNINSGELSSVFRYVESDNRISQSEINSTFESVIEEMTTTDPTLTESDSIKIEFIYGYKFYKKG